MRYRLLSSCLLLVACSGETAPEIPPAPTVPNAEVPGNAPPATPTTTAPGTPAPIDTVTPGPKTPDTVVESTKGPAIPTSLESPAAKAQCMLPRADRGSLAPTPPELEGKLSVEAALGNAKDGNGAEQLELRIFFPAQVDGDTSATTFMTYRFHSAASLDVGSHPGLDGDEIQNQFLCSKTETETGAMYNPPGALHPTWNITITSRTATHIEGWYERNGEGEGSRLTFSAPISDAALTRTKSVCCLD